MHAAVDTEAEPVDAFLVVRWQFLPQVRSGEEVFRRGFRHRFLFRGPLRPRVGLGALFFDTARDHYDGLSLLVALWFWAEI